MSKKNQFIKALINWKRVSDKLQVLSQNDALIDDIIEKELIEVIQEDHKKDFMQFMKSNEAELKKIKKRLKHKYKEEILKISSYLSSKNRQNML